MREGGTLAPSILEVGVKTPEAAGAEFEMYGGRIIETYPDGQPKKWICGVRGEHSGPQQLIDPTNGKEAWYTRATAAEKQTWGQDAEYIGHGSAAEAEYDGEA